MLYYPAKENNGLGTMALRLAGILVALSFTLDPGQRLLLLQNLAIQTTLITLEQMLRGGQVISAIQETVAVGMLAGGLDPSHRLTPYERLTDVQKAFYSGYDEGYVGGLKGR